MTAGGGVRRARWRRIAGAGVFAAAMVVAMVVAVGCGVPDRTDVVVDGPGPTTGVTSQVGDDGLPPGPEGTSKIPDEFVKRFLAAPAGDWEGAGERVKKFLSPEEREAWQPPRQITVVRLVNGTPAIKPPPNSEVVLDVQQIGVLTSRGTLDPPTAQTTQYKFSIARADEHRLDLVINHFPSGVMLLTDTALNTWFEQRPIYFWDANRKNLVPDLRYMPKAVEREARPNLVLGWLLGGPSGWLDQSVMDLPERTEQRGRAYQKNGRLVVNLSAAAGKEDLDELVTQLRWSLRDDYHGDLVLQIDDQDRRVETSPDDYYGRNPVYRLASRGPELYAVANGVIRRVQIDPTEAVPAAVPVLDPKVNKNVRYAAISGDQAALVRAAGGGRLQLWVGPDNDGRFWATDLTASTMSRPVLATGERVGYVAADGRLYQFTRDRNFTRVSAVGLPGNVTALALAPDGQRLAVVASGRPYTVALGGQGDGSTIGVARPVPTLLKNLSGISWLNETSLVTTGMGRDRMALERVSVDGAVQARAVQDLTVTTVTQLVAFPEDPVGNTGGRIMIEGNGRAYQVFTGSLQDVQAQDLAGPALASSVVPTAPFFAE